MMIDTTLKDILIWLSNKLCNELENNPYDLDVSKKRYADYLKECQDILTDLSNPDSVFYIIPQNNAIEIAANSMYQNYPNIKQFSAGDKSQIYNTLRSKITEFFINNGQVQEPNPVVNITVTDV